MTTPYREGGPSEVKIPRPPFGDRLVARWDARPQFRATVRLSVCGAAAIAVACAVDRGAIGQNAAIASWIVIGVMAVLQAVISLAEVSP